MRTNELISRCLILLASLGLVASASTADSIIRVHMIDAKSKLPIANKPVRVWTHGQAEQGNSSGFVQEVTDSKGVATCSLKDPIPSYLYIHTGMHAPWDEYFPEGQSGFVTREILQVGKSEESTCWKLPNIASKFQPSPGDVFIFIVHDTLLERLKALGH